MKIIAMAFLLSSSAFAGDISKEIELKSLTGKISERMIVISESAQNKTPEEVEKSLAALRKADAQLADVAPDSSLKTAAQRSDSLVRMSREGAAKGNLGMIRSGLAIFYGDSEGNYPKHPKELVPKYLKSIPTLELPDHKATNEIRVVTEAKGEKIDPYIKDTGGWVYVNDPNSPLHGQISIDCTHNDSKGRLMSGF